jgi:hypothetical protein
MPKNTDAKKTKRQAKPTTKVTTKTTGKTTGKATSQGAELKDELKKYYVYALIDPRDISEKVIKKRSGEAYLQLLKRLQGPLGLALRSLD